MFNRSKDLTNPQADVSDGTKKYHATAFFQTIATFFDNYELDDVTSLLGQALSDHVSKADDDGEVYYTADHIASAAFQHAEILTFLVKLKRVFSNYNRFVMSEEKEVQNV